MDEAPAIPLKIKEAIAQAVEIDVEDVRARVFTAEHLAAIALQTGRAKDKARSLQFLEADAIERERFSQILRRHALVDQWARFEQQFRADP